MDSRHERHALVPGWDQGRLSVATAAIAGMGAVGNEVARTLALAGVGTLIISDPDRVELSNLSRTPLFRAAQIGHFKVDAAAAALGDLAPGMRVHARPLPHANGIGLAELRSASVVIGCLDSRFARIQLAGRCNMVKAPYIDGGTHPWGGEVRPYLDSEGACYACSLTPKERATADSRWSCLSVRPQPSVGAAAPSSVLVGAWVALIAIRYLMGLPVPRGSLVIDGARGTTAVVAQERDPECPLHVAIGATTKVPIAHEDSVGALRAVLRYADGLLAWTPIQTRIECRTCGLQEPRWGVPELISCPRCGAEIVPRTTLEFADAPDELSLEALGVAPREVLALRTGQGFDWIELDARPRDESPAAGAADFR